MLHVPVLLEESLDFLLHNLSGSYLDLTFGRGTHSQEILKRLSPEGTLDAVDRDMDAVLYGIENIYDSRFSIHHSNYSEIDSLFSSKQYDGIILDLGTCSTHLDDPKRGFSFQLDGPLDMRIDNSKGISAEEWINTASKKEIEDVFWLLGEDRSSRKIAKKICDKRIKSPIKTTKDLSELILSAVSRQSKKHPATNIFRAIRMKINQELDELYKVLEASSYALCFGGRLAVISFHSIEDRVVKRFIQGKDRKESPIKFSYTGPKFIKASSEEIKINPRSRSAILRVAEKVM